MTPLQKIAMGLVIVVLVASFHGWDGLPNPLGWLLIGSGVLDARRQLPNTTAMLVLGGLAFVRSVVTYPPQVTKNLDPAATWLLDLPQVSFEVVLCASLAAVFGLVAGRWFRLLMWSLVLIGVGPAIAIGADKPAIADVVLAAWIVTQLWLVWILFSRSGDARTGAKPRPVRPPSPPAK